ncbi:hypothetical protein [Nocardia bhagyanarayanae]|uniref:Uncharacterized protein n=1 Tax=Nocardia bhagyanarayanae TaxID=1215925 RepID=A0A543FFP1_9NOCA|nr:hypothetical protein [Nocardia bhagyanarayanae]TQM32677.1 hypothetical protein FB390_4372 [Nocardia bhagyanarayanae]
MTTPMPSNVIEPLMELLGYLCWLVLLLCIARAIWIAGQLAVRVYRDEAIEGFVGALAAAALTGSASGIAIAVLPTQ